MELTKDRVREVFEYREDGTLVWKIATSNRAKIGAVAGGQRKTGYWFAAIDGKKYGVHRLVFLYHHGFMPPELDHIDRDPSNNRIENLRAATRPENNWNKTRQSNNTSGYKGVFWRDERKCWVARITVNGKTVGLGSYKTASDAAAAYEKAASLHHGEFARVA